MSGTEFYNWNDGSVGVASAQVRICASRSGKSGGIVFTTLAVAPGYLHHVGRPETEDAYGVETIRAALAAKVTADFPDCESPVRTTVSASLILEGYGPRREDGIRLDTQDREQMLLPCTEEEVQAARERLGKSVADGLADITKYWDDQGPEAWAEMVARSKAEFGAAQGSADA